MYKFLKINFYFVTYCIYILNTHTHIFSPTQDCLSFVKSMIITLFSILHPVTIKPDQHVVSKTVNQCWIYSREAQLRDVER